LAFPQEITIAVLDFDGDGVSQSETRTLTNRLRDEIFNTGIYIVLERGNMDEVLKEQGFQQTGCVTSECVVEVGNMLGVQQMIGGSIGKVGSIYTVSARVIDVQTGEVLKSANYDHIGDIGQLLIKGMKEVVNQLITGRKVKRSVIQTKGKGTLYITSTPSSADVWVDGYKVEGKTPLTIPDLDEGSHTIKFVKQMRELTKTVSVKANEITKVDAVLQLSTETLNVFSTPDGASVSIDGHSQRGLTPITVKGLSVGQHTVIITKDGHERHEAQINIEKNTTNRYSVNLEKMILGSIVVGDKYPSGTVVKLFWDGSEGMSGNASDNIIWKVKPKAYQLIISCPGYRTLKKDIEIIANEKIIISDPLESNEWILKEIKALKRKRNVSFIFAGLIAGTGGLIRNLDDSGALLLFSVSGVAFYQPFYYQYKIGTLTKML
jgi:TolB-like protein